MTDATAAMAVFAANILITAGLLTAGWVLAAFAAWASYRKDGGRLRFWAYLRRI